MTRRIVMWAAGEVWRRSRWAAVVAGAAAMALLAHVLPLDYFVYSATERTISHDAVVVDGKLRPWGGGVTEFPVLQVEVRGESVFKGGSSGKPIVRNWLIEASRLPSRGGPAAGAAPLPPLDPRAWIALMQESDDPHWREVYAGWLEPLVERNVTTLQLVDMRANIWSHVVAAWRAARWPLAGLATWMLSQWFLVARRLRLRAELGQCLRCGYDLGSARLELCPECGQPAKR